MDTLRRRLSVAPPSAVPEDPSQPRRSIQLVRHEVSLRSVLQVVAVIGVLWLVFRLQTVLLVLLVSFILAGTLAPLVEALERKRIPRHFGILGIFLGVLGFAALLGFITIPSLVHQVQLLLADAPGIQGRLVQQLSHTRATAPLAAHLRGTNTLAMTGWVAQQIVAYSSQALTITACFVTTVVLALYMVADRNRVRGFVYSLAPRRYHLRMARIALNLETIVGGYMRGQLITSLAMGVFTFALLTACRVPHALPLAVLAGLTDTIPMIGGLFALIPSLLAAIGRGTAVVVIVLVSMVLYQEIESRIIVPRIYGRVLRLSPAAVIIALFIGGELQGMLGVLLALPVAAGLNMILSELRVVLPGDDTDDTRLRERDALAEKLFAERSAGAGPEEAAAVATELADEIRRADAADPAEAAAVPITSGAPGP